MTGPTFNIGSQQGVINNVAGDQTVYGGQYAAITDQGQALQALEELRAAVAQLPLGPASAAGAQSAIGETKQALAADPPDKPAAASGLRRMAMVLKELGGVVMAGAAVLNPLNGLIAWLGSVGKRVLDGVD